MANMELSKYIKSESVELNRSAIHFAGYNPRKLSDESRKTLKRGIKKFGLVGGIVVNKRTGLTVVSGGFRWKLESDNKDMSVPLFRKSRSKLSYDDVVKIKQMAKDGIKQKEIAKSIGTSLHTVNNIVRGYCFKDV